MSAWRRFSLKVRRQETPFHAFVYKVAKDLRAISVPTLPRFHSFLYYEWVARTSMWHNFWRVLYYEPMFKSQCRSVGPGFKLWYAGNGCCRILGNLNIRLGSNVIMYDNVSLVGVRATDEPEFVTGDNVYLGPHTRFMVARKISIGNYTFIGSQVMMVDNASHSVNPVDRFAPGAGLPPEESIKPIRIGDFCSIPTANYVYPGAVIGDGVATKLGTHLRGVIPPFVLVSGHPCRIERALPIPEELKDVVGKDRWQDWHEERRAHLAKHPIEQRKNGHA